MKLVIMTVTVSLLLIVSSTIVPTVALGYEDFAITAYGSAPAGACTVWEPEGGGVLTVYVIYENATVSCVTIAEFQVVAGGGFLGAYLGESYPDGFALSGNTQDGIVLVSLTCWSPSRSTVLASIQYTTNGASPPCSWLEVVGLPDQDILVNTTTEGWQTARTYGKLSLNIDPWDGKTCGSQTWCVPVSTENTTWGRVKALYRE